MSNKEDAMNGSPVPPSLPRPEKIFTPIATILATRIVGAVVRLDNVFELLTESRGEDAAKAATLIHEAQRELMAVRATILQHVSPRA